jgi:hypothetical protein
MDRRLGRAWFLRSGYCERGCLHPHIHCVVPGGGISPDHSRWIACRNPFFLPVKVLSRLFRTRFLIHLRKAFQKGKLQFHGELQSLAQPAAFEELCRQAGKIAWVVYAKRPFGGPDQVLKYLARYTHRIAISNRRLISMGDGRVTFEWKDYADSGRTKTMTLETVEFIRRFLLHVLPSGFVHIRHFGFLANRKRKASLVLCRSLLQAGQAVADAGAESSSDCDSTPVEQVSHQCPVCKIGRMIFIQVVTAVALACLPAPMVTNTSWPLFANSGVSSCPTGQPLLEGQEVPLSKRCSGVPVGLRRTLGTEFHAFGIWRFLRRPTLQPSSLRLSALARSGTVFNSHSSPHGSVQRILSVVLAIGVLNPSPSLRTRAPPIEYSGLSLAIRRSTGRACQG